MGVISDEEPVVAKDSLFKRLQEKHVELRLRHLKDAQKSLEVDYSVFFKKMHDLRPSLDLMSDEIVIALNEIGWQCENHGVPHVGQLLKDVRAMMNRQLREAYASLEAGYKSAFCKLEEEAEDMARRRREANKGEELSLKGASKGAFFAERKPQDNGSVQKEVFKEGPRKKKQSLQRKTFSLTEAFSATMSFFAEMTAVLLGCEVVRIFLYDKYRNLTCCARFPIGSTKGDPMAGTELELILAKELHHTVCEKFIAVNGREPQRFMMSERDHEVLEDELRSSGWKSMTSCLIFPICASKSLSRSYGMIHAVNKQGVSADRPGRFNESDEVFISVTARLLGCLLTRYPLEYFAQPVDPTLQQCISEEAVKVELPNHLPSLLADEVEEAAEIGNKANQMCKRILLYRAPINAIYQTRLMCKKNRKLEALEMIDKGLSTVEFDIDALQELWQVAHKENSVIYQQCQGLYEQLNTLQILLRNVLDGIGASRTLGTEVELANYLQLLEFYARQENIPMLTELISKVLLNAKNNESLPSELQDVEPRGISADEIIRIKRRIAQTPAKLKFGASSPKNVRTYACDPQRRRDQVRFMDELAKQRENNPLQKTKEVNKARYESETELAKVKKVKKNDTTLLNFGPTDYVTNRVFRLDKK